MGNSFGAEAQCVPYEKTLLRVRVPLEGLWNDSRLDS